jgi:hypothetical protein
MDIPDKLTAAQTINKYFFPSQNWSFVTLVTTVPEVKLITPA